MRSGVIAKKLGMTSIFDEYGGQVPVTVLQIEKCQVTDRKTKSKDGYNAVQVGGFEVKPHKVSKPLKGFFAKNRVAPKKKLVEFRVSEDALLDIGVEIDVNHYVPDQFIDVTGITKGKGFAGVMKRWNFSGLRASHGVSISHRSHGSTGQCQDPGKVFKGKKMAGHMGAGRATQQNLRIVSVDKENNLLLVKGAIPGSKNSYILVKDALKVALPEDAPYPCYKNPESTGDNPASEVDDVKVSASTNGVGE